jgi:hypothetical protein
MRRRNGMNERCEQSGRRRTGAMSQTIQEENKALVQDAFDTLFNSRGTPRPSPRDRRRAPAPVADLRQADVPTGVSDGGGNRPHPPQPGPPLRFHGLIDYGQRRGHDPDVLARSPQLRRHTTPLGGRRLELLDDRRVRATWPGAGRNPGPLSLVIN